MQYYFNNMSITINSMEDIVMQKEVIVAGYICLDLLPEIYSDPAGQPFRYVPGQLLEVGGTDTCCGGAVPNTGLALYKLGHYPRLVGRIGNDAFGGAIRDLIDRVHQGLGDSLIVDPECYTANTIILNPPGQDRMFMVHTGANRNFSSRDLDDEMNGIRLLHFGYPPLLRESYRNNGSDTKALFAAAKRRGITTSLDMSLPSPGAEAAAIDWQAWLDNVLPEVDVFLPSLDELVFMLGWNSLPRDAHGMVTAPALYEMSGELLRRGVAVAVIKLGHHGIYVRTTADTERIAAMGACTPIRPDQWRNQEYISPCFAAIVKGTTGAGDCTIAGFLSGLLRGMSAADAGILACAVGACNVEAPDAFSGLQDFTTIQQRLRANWQREDEHLDSKIWTATADGVYVRERR